MKQFLCLTLTAALLSSCFSVNTNYKSGKNSVKGEGPVITKSLDLNGFNSIVINGQADVTFTQADTFDVTLTTQENIFDYIDYHVEGDVLLLETKDKAGVRAERYDVTVTAPSLVSLTVNGASDFDIKKLRMEEDLKVEVNGAGDLSFDDLACRDLSIVTNGASDIRASVEVQSVKIVVNGAGDVKIGGMAKDASFEVNGAGDVDARNLSVAGEVNRKTSGLAKIKL